MTTKQQMRALLDIIQLLLKRIELLEAKLQAEPALKIQYLPTGTGDGVERVGKA